MRNTIKKIYGIIPLSLKAEILLILESYYRRKAESKERKELPLPPYSKGISRKEKKRVLIYHKSALYFGGTERCLQIVAKILSDQFDIFILHATDTDKPNRLDEVNKYATLIPFSYESIDSKYPYYIEKMHPHIKSVIEKWDIDLLIVSGPGKTEYPFITVTDIPIVQMNNFGAPTMQKNIQRIIFVSEEIRNHSEFYTGKREKDVVLPIPVDTTKTKESVPSLRKTLSLSDTDFLFGRIGRGADDIFDPIGIEAFKQVVAKYPTAHYVIVSPPPKLQRIVTEENIPNIHFLEATIDEDVIWSFHYGIDALAHFRYDGETQGLNIGEAMYAGKPIISHKSPIWNAHAEYLDKSFARMAQTNNVDEYASYMEEFIQLKERTPEQWRAMSVAAKKKADTLFSITSYQKTILALITDIL